MKKVLFFIEKACRSQIDQGFFNKLASNAFADSAGTQPAKKIDPVTEQVMKEKNINIIKLRRIVL